MPYSLSADRPLTAAQDDDLGREAFAASLARAICARRGQENFIIALYGPWGCGKTSIKNMALEALRKQPDTCPLIVEFEPWLWNDVTQLTQAFFDAISAALETHAQASDKATTQDEINKRQRRLNFWKRYSAFFTASGILAKGVSALRAAQGEGRDALELAAVAANLDAVAHAARYAGDVTEDDATQIETSSSLADVRNNLTQSLRDLEHPLLVIIDDIDRLHASEIATLFQLVKSNADFPNVVFLLLFQRDVVERSLEQVAPGRGRSFLEKIVQAGFDVPVVNEDDLKRIFAKSLEEVFEADGIPVTEHERRFRTLLVHILPFFSSVREVRRYCNGLSFHLDVLREPQSRILEINPADLAALEIFRTFEPEVYARIADNKILLTTERSTTGETRNVALEKSATEFIQGLIASAQEANRGHVKSLLGALFPQVVWITRSSPNYYNSVPYNEALKSLQVCHPAIFDRYFQMAIHARDISHAEWKTFMAKTGDKVLFADHLRDFHARGVLDVVLGRLTSWADRIPLEHAASFLAAIFDVGDVFPAVAIAPGFAFWGQELQTRALLQRYFSQSVSPYKSEEPQERDSRRHQLAAAFEQALQSTTGCFFPIYLLAYEERKPERAQEFRYEENFLLNQEDALAMREIGLSIIRRAAADGSLLALPNRMISVYGCWRDWGGDEAKSWLEGVLSTGAGVTAFLRHCVHEGFQWTDEEGSAYRAVELRTVHDYLPIWEVERRIEALDEEKFTTEEREAVDLFRVAMARWRAGHLSPHETRELPNPNDEPQSPPADTIYEANALN